MPILENTKNVNYKSLPFTATEEDAVIYHFAAQVDDNFLNLPIPLSESKQKKMLLLQLADIGAAIKHKFSQINPRLFKLKFLAPGRIDDIFKQVKRPITIAKYDVVFMLVCENQEVAEKLKNDTLFQDILNLITKFPKHNIATAKNIRKAGDSYVHEQNDTGVYLFNYFYVENKSLDFLPVWEFTSRWFAEHTKLNNSYLLKPISGDDHFQYINHCYWPSLWDFVPPLIFKRDAKTYVLDNFSYNKAIAFPVIYSAIAIL